MELKFLGHSYEAASASITVVDSEVMGKYRGQVWVKKRPEDALAKRPFLTLKYRGVKYSSLVCNQAKEHQVTVTPAQHQSSQANADLTVIDGLSYL